MIQQHICRDRYQTTKTKQDPPPPFSESTYLRITGKADRSAER